jgi:hypothetical protein
MNPKRLAAILVFSLLLFPGKGLASIIYEQLPGPASNTLLISSARDNFGSTPGYRVADDFVLTADAVITDLHWWGQFSEQVTPGGKSFSFTFYDDNPLAPGPGAVLHVSGGSLTEQTVNTGPGPVVFYSSILDSPFSATGGSRYWLSVFDGAADASWLWLIANNPGNGSTQELNPGPAWFSVSADMAFQITSEPVPEPASMLLLGSGLLGLIGYRRRSA